MVVKYHQKHFTPNFCYRISIHNGASWMEKLTGALAVSTSGWSTGKAQFQSAQLYRLQRTLHCIVYSSEDYTVQRTIQWSTIQWTTVHYSGQLFRDKLHTSGWSTTGKAQFQSAMWTMYTLQRTTIQRTTKHQDHYIMLYQFQTPNTISTDQWSVKYSFGDFQNNIFVSSSIDSTLRKSTCRQYIDLEAISASHKQTAPQHKENYQKKPQVHMCT